MFFARSTCHETLPIFKFTNQLRPPRSTVSTRISHPMMSPSCPHAPAPLPVTVTTAAPSARPGELGAALCDGIRLPCCQWGRTCHCRCRRLPWSRRSKYCKSVLGCRSLLGKDIERDAVGRQLKPHLASPVGTLPCRRLRLRCCAQFGPHLTAGHGCVCAAAPLCCCLGFPFQNSSGY